jgi:hypothetical protein
MQSRRNVLKKKCLTVTQIFDAPLNVVWRAWKNSSMVVDFKNLKNNKTKITIRKYYKMNDCVRGAPVK